MWGSVRSVFVLVSSLYHIFATQPRFLSPIQLLVTNELFHQSSLYLIDLVLSFQFLCKQRYLHFSCGEMFGRKCPRPVLFHMEICDYYLSTDYSQGFSTAMKESDLFCYVCDGSRAFFSSYPVTSHPKAATFRFFILRYWHVWCLHSVH